MHAAVELDKEIYYIQYDVRLVFHQSLVIRGPEESNNLIILGIRGKGTMHPSVGSVDSGRHITVPEAVSPLLV